MANYKPKLPTGEAWEKALNSGGGKLLEGARGSLIQIHVPAARKAIVQVFPGGGVTIFCSDVEELHRCEDWVNEKLGTPDNPAPLGRPVEVREQGSRPAYYETQEEVVERLSQDPCALDIMNFDKQLQKYPLGHPEKIELLSAAVDAVSRLLGPFTIPFFERALKAETDREAARIMVKGIPRVFSDFASFFLWLLREHKDVAHEALSSQQFRGYAAER